MAQVGRLIDTFTLTDAAIKKFIAEVNQARGLVRKFAKQKARKPTIFLCSIDHTRAKP